MHNFPYPKFIILGQHFMFNCFDCEMSMKARTRIIDDWKQMNFQRESTYTLQTLAQLLNAKYKGIINYYGKMNILCLEKLFRHLDNRIAKWVKNKFKKLGSYQKAND
jgi:RNA-directed DNA polymerase